MNNHTRIQSLARPTSLWLAIALCVGVGVAPVARAASAVELLAGYSAQAGGAADPGRGRLCLLCTISESKAET